MALSPEGPGGGAPPPASNASIAGFIGGLLLGMAIGGTVLMLFSVLLVTALGSLLFPKSTGNWAPFVAAIPALAIGWWAVVRTGKAINFWSGSLIGLAVGLLGGSVICGLISGGLSG